MQRKATKGQRTAKKGKERQRKNKERPKAKTGNERLVGKTYAGILANMN